MAAFVANGKLLYEKTTSHYEDDIDEWFQEYISNTFHGAIPFSENYSEFLDRIFLTAKIAGFLSGNCDPENDLFPDGNIFKPKRMNEMFDPFDNSHWAVAYAQSVTGVKHPGDACSLKSIMNTRTAEFDNYLHSGSINPCNLELVNVVDDRNINNLLRLCCQEDQFNLLAHMYRELAKDKHLSYDDYETYWKELPPVFYIINKIDRERIVVKRYICRFNDDNELTSKDQTT